MWHGHTSCLAWTPLVVNVLKKKKKKKRKQRMYYPVFCTIIIKQNSITFNNISYSLYECTSQNIISLDFPEVRNFPCFHKNLRLYSLI